MGNFCLENRKFCKFRKFAWKIEFFVKLPEKIEIFRKFGIQHDRGITCIRWLTDTSRSSASYVASLLMGGRWHHWIFITLWVIITELCEMALAWKRRLIGGLMVRHRQSKIGR